MSARDKYTDLATVIDIGGDIYDLQASENVDLSHKSRDTFLRTFGSNTYKNLPVEYLLRKYLPIGQKIDEILFTSPEEYDQLIDILNRRARQLQMSQQFNSQVVRNIAIRRYYSSIIEIIEELRSRRTVKKRLIPKLQENDIFQYILEIAWYLAHPNEIPAEMEKEWKVVVELLKKQRLSDIVEEIRKNEEEKGLPTEEHPLQYFKKLDMDDVVDANTLAEAAGRARNMTTIVNAVPIRPDMGRRLRNLMNVLQLKRYVDSADPINQNGIRILNTKRLSNSLPSNPMKNVQDVSEEKSDPDENKAQEEQEKGQLRGGAVNTLSVPLGQAMLPVFRYLQMLYDPVYSMLEQVTTSSVKRAILPHLLLLLHLCNEFNTPTIKPEFGLYHLKNIPSSLLSFLTEQLEGTENHVSAMKTEEKEVFQRQLFHLPKVRLRSLLKNNGSIPSMTNTYQSIFHLQFFVVGQNLTIPDDMDFKKRNPNVDSKVLDKIRDALVPDSVFLSYTDAGTTSENIPFRFFEVDYNSIKMNKPGIEVRPFSPELDNLEKEGFLSGAYLDKLVTIKPYVTYNDTELVLSVLMGLKERMPK